MATDGREIMHLKRRAHLQVVNPTRAAVKTAAIMESMDGDDMGTVIDFPVSAPSSLDDIDEPSAADLADIERDLKDHPLEFDEFYISEDDRPADLDEDIYPSGPIPMYQE